MEANLDKANASPTKNFFVSMLTRDISLADAILDLVDNSLDGVLRCAGGAPVYEGFFADIRFDTDQFSITDNCGGLDRSIAIDYAFKMGRDSGDDRDDRVETIGMYGIGMKRAMFKMGLDCSFLTHAAGNDHYRVVMGRKWLSSRAWNKLPLEVLGAQDRLEERGSRIVVRDLRPGIRAMFGEAGFEKELMDSLGEHFAKFLDRGFRITVNGNSISPVRIQLLYERGDDVIKPCYMTGSVGETHVRVAMGLNARALHAEAGPVGPLAVPGWSVFCNDRAVLVGDTTRLTGWADPPIPRYHDQYDVLTGIVEFRASDARDLPVTTTKRDLDASSEAWLTARFFMRLAMRRMVTYTNAWKNDRAEQRKLLGAVPSVELDAIQEGFEHGQDSTLLRKHSGTEHMVFNPKLPKPSKSSSKDGRITYQRPKSQIKRLGYALLENPQAAPSQVGEASFDFAYRELVGD